MEFRFLLTPACNFRCKFCHEEGIKGCYKKVRLDVDDIEYVFSLGKKCFNWRTVTLTGGEPTLFGGISQLCKKLYDIGASITLQTNGSTLMENFNMLEYVSQVNISLHTMDPLFYKDIIGVSFPHDRLISNILYLRARFPLKRVHFNVVMTRECIENSVDMDNILNFARSVSAIVKFIEVTSEDLNLIVDRSCIEVYLMKKGFKKVLDIGLSEFFRNDVQEVVVVRCDFGESIITGSRRLTRDVFIASDGTFRPYANEDLEIDMLYDIKKRKDENILEKINLFWNK